MKHQHKFETTLHYNISPELMDHGLLSGEVRKCMKCGKEIPFVQTRKGWFPLFSDREADEQDILLA